MLWIIFSFYVGAGIQTGSHAWAATTEPALQPQYFQLLRLQVIRLDTNNLKIPNLRFLILLCKNLLYPVKPDIYY